MKKGDITCSATAEFNTRKYGRYQISIYKANGNKHEHVVLKKGIKNGEKVYCRFFSECSTGIIFDANSCDCKEQLDYVLELFKTKRRAILIFLREEGRGQGLSTKIRALANKNLGYDTFAAVEKLGLLPDTRNHETATFILQIEKIKSIYLLTNNPDKVKAVKKTDIKILKTIPIPVIRTKQSELHLIAKRQRGHSIKFKDNVIKKSNN